MSPQDEERALFDRVWAKGALVATTNRDPVLAEIASSKPTLEQYRKTYGSRKTDLIRIIKLGISQLHASGELQEP